MNQILFQFHAELNDLLPRGKQNMAFDYHYNGQQTIKHLIEAMGVPHTEVEAILVNGRSVDFSYSVQNSDQIHVYPASVSLAIDSLIPLRPPLPNPPRFILDIHLGRLANYLRLLGFDCWYPFTDPGDEALAQRADEENRIMLTRDRGLLKRGRVTHGYCLRSRHPKTQLTQVLTRFNLYDKTNTWTRCLKCNGSLRPVEKADVLHLLEPKTIQYYDHFHQCRDCQQVYWKGSHFQALEALIEHARPKKEIGDS